MTLARYLVGANHIADHLNTRCYQGFTLIEVLISISILVIITVMVAPTFVSHFTNWESHRIHNIVVNSYRQAKIKSHLYHQNIILCPSQADNICHKDASEFLLMFSDVNNNNRFDINIDKLLVKEALKLKYGRIHLRAGRRHYIKFYANTGLPRGHFGHIKYCPFSGNAQHTFMTSINPQGNYRLKPFSNKPTNCPVSDPT